MARTFQVSDDIIVEADPSTVYAQVSDPSLMGRWSPENLGATVREGQHTGAHVGMVFDGRNKRGALRWTTRCTVTAADPGGRFEFRVHAIGLKNPRLRSPIATWEYRFEQVPEGTKVTETWTDDRRSWPAEFQRKNISTTLRRLKTQMEAPASS